jgi:putative tryptophan/tyrosine transport system ATP-binding protein
MLTLNNVNFSVPNRKLPIINNISFSVAPNDFIVIVGGNGSGKSTLINLINHSYRVSSGFIDFLQQPLKNYSNKELAKSVITITQNIKNNLFTDMTIAENAALYELRYKSLFDQTNKKQRLHELQEYLLPFSHKLAVRLDTTVNLLSGGEQQILILALCLRYPPKLLLLDEHTSALDPKTAKIMMEKTYHAIRDRNITCIMTTHNLSFATSYGNRLLALKDGKISQTFEVNKKAQITQQELLDACY